MSPRTKTIPKTAVLSRPGKLFGGIEAGRHQKPGSISKKPAILKKRHPEQRELDRGDISRVGGTAFTKNINDPVVTGVRYNSHQTPPLPANSLYGGTPLVKSLTRQDKDMS